MFETLRIPFLSASGEPTEAGRRSVRAQQDRQSATPTLRLRCKERRNLEPPGLLADPWPGPWIETPPIQIKNGTIELYPCEDRPRLPIDRLRRPLAALAPSAAAPSSPPHRPEAPASIAPRERTDHSPAILRDVTLNIKPSGKGQRDLKFEGTASGDGFERLDTLRNDRPQYRQYRVERRARGIAALREPAPQAASQARGALSRRWP